VQRKLWMMMVISGTFDYTTYGAQLQLPLPLLAVQLVENAVERALLRQMWVRRRRRIRIKNI
jgi:hypothetical protein